MSRLRVIRAERPLTGSVRVPSDKSMSHRSVLFAAMAEGESHLTGVLDSADVRSTMGAVEALGAEVRVGGDRPGRPDAHRPRLGSARSAAARWADRLRQLGHDGATAHGRACGLADRGHAHRRRVPVAPADEAGDGPAPLDGRDVRSDRGRNAPAHRLRRSAHRHRIRDPCRERAGEDRRASRGSACRRRHERDRACGEPRPHRAHAAGLRRAGRLGRPPRDGVGDGPGLAPRVRRRGPRRSFLGGLSGRRGSAGTGERDRTDRGRDEPDAGGLCARLAADGGGHRPRPARPARPRAGGGVHGSVHAAAPGRRCAVAGDSAPRGRSADTRARGGRAAPESRASTAYASSG